MKYLFIVQGEGRGHLTQAITLSDMLRRNGHEVCGVLVGKSSGRQMPAFFYEKVGAKVESYQSPNFVMSRDQKHVSLRRTMIRNLSPLKFFSYIQSMEFVHGRIKSLKPDVIINFYEMLTGFVALRYDIDVPIVSVAHQYLIMHPDYRFGLKNENGRFLLQLTSQLCNIGTTKSLALSFYKMRDFFRERIAVVPPLLRSEVLAMEPSDKGYILGYMLNAGFADEVKAWHAKHPEVPLHFFWDKRDAPEELVIDDTLTFHRINDIKFIEMMKDCRGYVSTAGFESVCEAMYLMKPTMLIPVHLEQEINAEDACSVGMCVTSEHFDLSILMDYIATNPEPYTEFREWVRGAESDFVRHLTTLV